MSPLLDSTLTDCRTWPQISPKEVRSKSRISQRAQTRRASIHAGWWDFHAVGYATKDRITPHCAPKRTFQGEHHAEMDRRGARQAGGAYSELEAVGSIDRPAHGRGQGQGGEERRPGRRSGARPTPGAG